MKINFYGERLLNTKQHRDMLRMWQELQLALNEIPMRYRDKEFRMFQIYLKIKIADIKSRLYGEQAELTLPLQDRKLDSG